MGDNLPEQMLKSAYIGIMDSLTRSHLTPYQGKNTSADDFKSHILRFVTNAVLDTHAMQVGSIESGDVGGASSASEHTYSPGEEENGLGVISMQWDIITFRGLPKENLGAKERIGKETTKGKGKEGKGGKERRKEEKEKEKKEKEKEKGQKVDVSTAEAPLCPGLS